MSRVRLIDYNREELAELAPRATLVVPTSATEQHGPHLTVGTDALAVEHIAWEGARRVWERGQVCLVAPTLAYGASHHHLPLPGTLSLRGETFLRAIAEIADSASRWGIKRLFFLNGHGGNESLVQQAVRDLVLDHQLLAGAASYWTLAWEQLASDPSIPEIASDIPGHAGGFETSIMLALHPELVDQARYGDKTSRRATPPLQHQLSRPFVQRPGWIQAMEGYSDSPRRASAEAGRHYLEMIVEAVAGYLTGFAQAEL